MMKTSKILDVEFVGDFELAEITKIIIRIIGKKFSWQKSFHFMLSKNLNKIE